MDYNKARAFLDSDATYLLSTHRNADGDGIGAMLAMGEALAYLNRPYRMVICDEKPNQKFAFLAGFDRIEYVGALPGSPSFSRGIFVDTPTLDPKRVGEVADLLTGDAQKLIIDHHTSPDEEGDVRLVDPNASAASELVYRFVQAVGIPVSPEMATQLYAGIAYDTKLFKFSHPKHALKVCAQLVDLGAEPEMIADVLFARERFETIKTLGVALATLELHLDGRVNTLVVDHKTYQMGGEMDLVVDQAMSIDGIEATLFFKEESPGSFRMSLRSRGRVNVNTIAQIFGGGGHPRASGCQLKMSLEEAKRVLLAEVEKQLASGPSNNGGT
ncbi:MAG: bifunctional oligoribonuclease/PAP phosphatase NrnA [bacterium]|nr:bifunctional oligoribonuclease/PAP phosphatase NrnA [bacterium]